MLTVPAPVPAACLPELAVMAAVVTVMSAVPVAGGLVTVICVPESAVIVPSTPPNRTTVAPASPVPVIFTVLPPTVLPPAGDTPVIAGSPAGWEPPDPARATARTVPATATATATAMAALAARECRSRDRRRPWRRGGWCRGTCSTLLPWTAAAPPDGH